MLQVSVYRYNPDQDEKPFMQDFQVNTEGKDLMVLDVLALIKEQDQGFSYRRSCREGVCGSDGMNINGKNGLACITPLSSVVKGNKLVIRPLPGLPVIRDLVVDMGMFYMGSPNVSVDATGMLEDTSKEEEQLQANFADYKWLPQLNFRISFRF